MGSIRDIIMDIIKIENLEVEAIIGIHDWEREVRQLINVNLEMEFDSRRAGKTDNIYYALDYKKVTKILIELIKEAKSKLIENLAEIIATKVLTEFPVKSVKLEVSKPGALRGSKSVGIIIKRQI